jgi:hypothetical protein
MSEFNLENVNEGDSVRLRNGTISTVEFIAYMPDDLHMDYDYVVRLSGHEAGTFTEKGIWIYDDENNIDIIEIIKNNSKTAFQFGYEAFAAKIQCAAHDQAFMDMHIKGLKVGETEPLSSEWSKGYVEAQEKYLKENFPEMYPS